MPQRHRSTCPNCGAVAPTYLPDIGCASCEEPALGRGRVLDPQLVERARRRLAARCDTLAKDLKPLRDRLRALQGAAQVHRDGETTEEASRIERLTRENSRLARSLETKITKKEQELGKLRKQLADPTAGAADQDSS